jgi:DNA adenine methylase
MPKPLSLIKIHGGKGMLTKFILDNFPPNYEELTYVEPFVGGGSVFLNKRSSKAEVINDLDLDLSCLWTNIKCEHELLVAVLKTIKYSEEEFNNYKTFIPIIPLEAAVKSFVLHRMSRGGLCKTYAWSDRLRRGKPEQISSWETAIENISLANKRLTNTLIYNRTAIEVIKEHNCPRTLIYEDPPYIHETRTAKSTYEHEMTLEDHIDLARVNNASSAKIIISGYPSATYNELYKGWRVVTKEVANHSGQNKVKNKRTEVLWCNF